MSTKKGKAKPRTCKIVEINQGLPDAELRVCAPEGYLMKSFDGRYYKSLELVPEKGV